jgi:hypothetical protein
MRKPAASILTGASSLRKESEVVDLRDQLLAQDVVGGLERFEVSKLVRDVCLECPADLPPADVGTTQLELINDLPPELLLMVVPEELLALAHHGLGLKGQLHLRHVFRHEGGREGDLHPSLRLGEN